MSPHAATFRQALAWLDLHMGWHPDAAWMPLEHWSERGGWRTEWHKPWDRSTAGSSAEILARYVELADMDRGEQVMLGIPRCRIDGGVRVATVLWVVTSGPEQSERLAALNPQPSLILREGQSTRRVSFWPLEHAVKWEGIDRGNRRLAYRCGAVQKQGDPDRLEFPAPGTVLRRGRTRPVPVVVERLSMESFTPLAVVGKLRDPPPADAWKTRVA